jgi:hypothetical protein
MPIDAEPRPDGNVVLEEDGTARVLGREARQALGAFARLHTSHFATCPHAGQWRSSKKEPARG